MKMTTKVDSGVSRFFVLKRIYDIHYNGYTGMSVSKAKVSDDAPNDTDNLLSTTKLVSSLPPASQCLKTRDEVSFRPKPAARRSQQDPEPRKPIFNAD